MGTETFLVTGGAGFIGSNLADELIRRGGRVRIIDNLVTGSRNNLEEIGGADVPQQERHRYDPPTSRRRR